MRQCFAILCLAVMGRTCSGLSTKYVLETGSGFETQSGILSLTLNSSSSATRIDLMPGVDDITPITEYLVHEQDSVLKNDQVTGLSVSWSRAGDQAAAAVVPVSIRVKEAQVHQTSGRERTVRKFCSTDNWLFPDRLYPMSQC